MDYEQVQGLRAARYVIEHAIKKTRKKIAKVDGVNVNFQSHRLFVQTQALETLNDLITNWEENNK